MEVAKSKRRIRLDLDLWASDSQAILGSVMPILSGSRKRWTSESNSGTH
jgi:hypothetical protein